MTSENSVRATASATPRSATSERAPEQTRTIPPVPLPPEQAPRSDGDGASPPPPPPTSASSAPASVAPTTNASPGASQGHGSQAASADDSDTGAGVKAGAMKAAAAAIAAAKSAAKKVQSAMPDPSQSAPRPAAQGASAGATAAAGAAGAQPRPTMHYSAGGVRGTAVPGPTASTDSSAAAAARVEGPRRVRLSVSRIDPWSIMKLAFLLAVAIGVMTVVATAVIWYVLDGLGVFATVQEFIENTVGPQTSVNVTQFVEFDRLVSLATLIAVVNVILLTAIATIMTILYNIVAALVGGVHLTLTDD